VDRAKRRANVAASLVALGRPEKVWPLLIHSSDPTVRSYLIERLGTSGVSVNTLKQRLDQEKDTSARRALVLVLGGLEPQANVLPELERDLLALYENHPDAGIHAAAGWVLRKWKKGQHLRPIDEKLATARVEKNRLWYVNKQCQTFSIIDGPRGLLQRAGKLPQAPGHRFAIASTEVTVAQFRAFKKDHRIAEEVATTLDCPVNMISWYDAAEYCNWLSLQDGIPESQWCYRPNKEKMLEFVPDYQSCIGYRLPTENEWEFACRAGAQTLWSFGREDEELLGKYAWWVGNAHAGGERRCFPVGSLKPNDFGLFDMHGNLGELCQEAAMPLGRLINDIECGGRGGCYFAPPRAVACDRPFLLGRTMTAAHIGFRPVRTMP
jgi:hypothetical protein